MRFHGGNNILAEEILRKGLTAMNVSFAKLSLLLKICDKDDHVQMRL